MKKFDLDTPILQFGDSQEDQAWTIRNAVEGVQIFGGIGSGKTSGSGKTLAVKYLQHGFGGLVLTAKTDEADLWRHYCKETGRENDLIIIEPGGSFGFDFLQYLSVGNISSEAITAQALETLKTVIRAGNEKSTGKSDDPFWESAVDMLLFHVMDLCMIAYQKISVKLLYEIVQTLPKVSSTNAQNGQPAPENAFKKAMLKAKTIVQNDIDLWYKSLSKEQRARFADQEAYENAVVEHLPNARLMKHLDTFFYETFKDLSSKTRSIVEFSFSAFLFRLLRDPVYSLFCKGSLNLKPEDCLTGKIILINLPVKLYHNVGRDCQVLFKYIWQVAMEKRDILKNDRPCFLWADESQFFLHEHDALFQATARSCRIATVYLTQNIHQYKASMGGSSSDDRVDSFLGTLSTKIFHANADLASNRLGSDLVGDTTFYEPSSSITTAKEFSRSDSVSLKIDRRIRPEEFVGMKTGGKRNGGKVEAIIHVQGDKLFSGESFKKVRFNQNIL
ncbi:type IV secretory system conjugative DNA transfer family protein [Mucilaginibacter polytrichastri]|uniref:TraD/TraG TraM recognition site domain-containing protein n=1 Tax=Mucilaginibacter polytrichastri TaxID=1302689 RepID=A0A1Q6A2E8_9SPHI|nr:TraM recognition domain-containing protein [Mucilaginibacter polytrichastri]OKS88183.1 hypothetical protein RG47T_3647 [Mucilaginibacter polytrichastri]SFT08763.1 TraM recognition site of TraD and TraG [Mucilaginibacter polytrichastri]